MLATNAAFGIRRDVKSLRTVTPISRPIAALTQSWCNSRRSCAAFWWRMSIMGRGLPLAPCGLVVEHMQSEAGDLVITARPALRTAACPACGSASARVHSTYQRSLADLPSHGQAVRIRVSTRRFRCVLASCRQRIFTERLAATAARPFARRTSRLEGIVHHLGLALGGRPGQSFARRLLLPVSKDTLLRVVRRHAALPTEAPRVVGIDDWAFKRGQRYGTIICDLERRRIVDCCPTARRQPLPRGLPRDPRSRSSRGIVVPAISRPPPMVARTRYRLPTDGT